MAQKQLYFHVFFVIASNSFLCDVYSSATITLLNKCSVTVWPGIFSNAQTSLATTGFALRPSDSKVINAPDSWNGRVWARTHCSNNSTTGKFHCLTGDCGTGRVDCSGGDAQPPVTLAEFQIDGFGSYDFYDVSLVDGYNIAMLVEPLGGVNCTTTGCVSDLNGNCPRELRMTTENGGGGTVVACRSACLTFKNDQFCCRGAYSTPEACFSTLYAQAFKSACPHAYSYPFDDATSTFTCSTDADYAITFCPSNNNTSKLASPENPEVYTSNSNNPQHVNNGNTNTEGASDSNSYAPPTRRHMMGVAVAVMAALWRLPSFNESKKYYLFITGTFGLRRSRLGQFVIFGPVYARMPI